MASITFDVVGTELAQVRAENPSPLAPIESGARVRVKKFSAGAATAGQQIELAEFGTRVTILGGAVTAISTAGDLDIGWTLTGAPVDDNLNVFADGVSAAAEFAPYQATTTGATTVFATANTGSLTSCEGYILYVENS
jgi:hypothetical protein